MGKTVNLQIGAKVESKWEIGGELFHLKGEIVGLNTLLQATVKGDDGHLYILHPHELYKVDGVRITQNMLLQIYAYIGN